MIVNFLIIGKRVKEFRIKNRMSQADLAERIEMSVVYISYIETAKKHASLETLVRIANALGVTVNHLLSGDQVNDTTEYLTELMQLIEDCTGCEKRIIYEIALATRKSLLQNKWFPHIGEANLA